MKRKIKLAIISVVLIGIGWIAGHATSPDAHTVQKLGEAQQAYIKSKAAFDGLCPIFLENQSKLEARLQPGEVLKTYNCGVQYMTPTPSLSR